MVPQNKTEDGYAALSTMYWGGTDGKVECSVIELMNLIDSAHNRHLSDVRLFLKGMLDAGTAREETVLFYRDGQQYGASIKFRRGGK